MLERATNDARAKNILKNLILTPKNEVRPYPTIHREQKDGRCTFTTTPCEPNYTGLLMSSLNGLQFFLASLLAFSCAKHYRLMYQLPSFPYGGLHMKFLDCPPPRIETVVCSHRSITYTSFLGLP